jgi:hypothetical protein
MWYISVFDGPYVAKLHAKQQRLAIETQKLLNDGLQPMCTLHITFFAMVDHR